MRGHRSRFHTEHFASTTSTPCSVGRRDRMKEGLPEVEPVAHRGAKQVALATVVKVGLSSAPVGGTHGVTDGDLAGSVSGGCVETASSRAQEVLSTRRRADPYGITDEMAWDVGLACGGTIEVFVEPVNGMTELTARRVHSLRAGATPRPSAMATVVRGGRRGRTSRPARPDCLPVITLDAGSELDAAGSFRRQRRKTLHPELERRRSRSSSSRSRRRRRCSSSAPSTSRSPLPASPASLARRVVIRRPRQARRPRALPGCRPHHSGLARRAWRR